MHAMDFIRLCSGRKLAFAEFGDPGGVPAFYFHGWPSACVQGMLMDEAAREAGIRIIAPDRPGIGDSDPQPGRRLLDWPPVLAELADHLGCDRFHVIGVSGGGPYVYAAVHAMPERLLSANVVCGAPPLKVLGTQDLFWPYRMVLLVRRRMHFLLGAVFGIGARVSKQKPSDVPMRWLLGMLNEEDRRVMRDEKVHSIIAQGFRDALRQSVEHVQADADIYLDDWGFDLQTLQYPLHLWHGREDRNIPFSYAEKVAVMLPNVITHWTERDGHYSLAARCRDVAQVILRT